MTSFCSRKPIFRQPKRSKSLVIIPSARTGTFGRQGPVSSGTHNTGWWCPHFHPLWPGFPFLFLSPLCLPRIPTQITPVLKSFSPTTLLFNFLTSTPLPSETVLLILAPGPSILTSFLTPLTLSSSETSMLTTQRGTDSFPLTPLGNDLFRWITSSGLEILNDPASPTLLHHSTGSRSSPWYLVSSCVSRSPLWVAHSPWPWLGPSPHWNCPPLLSSSSTKHTSPQIQLQKDQLGYLPILRCWAPSLSWFWCTQHPPGCPLLFPILSRSCQGLYPLWPPWSFPPKPSGPRKRNLQFGNDGGPAPWHTDLSRTASDT